MPTSPAPHQTITSIAQARAVASAMVAASHTMSSMSAFLGFKDFIPVATANGTFQIVTSLLYIWPLNGALPVHFFFVLSGFVLVLAAQKHPYATTLAAYTRFVIHRLLRLWPAHLAVLAFILLMLWAGATFGWFHPHVRLHQSPFPYPIDWPVFLRTIIAHATTYNPVVWTLRYELFATFYILPCIWLVARARPAVALSLLPVLMLLDLSPSKLLSPFDYAYMFYLGILAAYYRNHPLVVRLMPANPWPAVLALFILSGAPRILLAIPSGTLSPTAKLSDALLAAVTLLILYHHGRRTSATPSRAGAMFASLGSLSYSFYLLHYICLFIVFGALLNIFGPQSFMDFPWRWLTILFAGSFALGLGLAALNYKYIEKPALHLARR